MNKNDIRKANIIRRNNNIENYKNKILNNTHNIWIPSNTNYFIKQNENTCFDIMNNNNIPSCKLIDKIYYHSNIKNFPVLNFKTNIPNNYNSYKTIKVEMKLTNLQKNIFQRWFKASTLMYNETIKFIKNSFVNDKNYKISFRNIRTNNLYVTKQNIVNSSPINNNIQTKIYSHILDETIKLACSNYKSALSNLKNKNIKHFRIRFWRFNRKNLVLDFEKKLINKNKLCYNVFGNIIYKYNNKNFNLNNVNSHCKVHYNKETNKYYLLICKLENYDNNINNLKETIVLDPGIRTFLTGLSNKTVTHIGYGMDKKIKKLHLSIKDLNKKNKIHKKKKKIKKIRKKIKNLINEMHNKTILYLTSNYKNILIGNMSSKSIVKKGNNINKMTKQIAMSYSFYVFKHKLLIKCIEKRNNYKEINESYTSKMCSNCGTLNNKLKGSKIFSCNNCNLLIDRDVNGARGILIKSL